MKSNSLVKNENFNLGLIFFTIYFLSLFCLYNFWLNLVGLITDKFASTIQMLPIIISYLLPIIYIIVLFRQLYFKTFSKGGLISFLVITTILLIGSISLFVLKYDYHLNNFLSQYKSMYNTLDNIFIVIGLLVINLVLFIKLLTHKFDFKYRDPISVGVFNTYSSFRMLFVGIYLIFSGYFLITGLSGCLAFYNFLRFPLEYGVLICALIFPFITFIFYLFLNPKKPKTFIGYSILFFIDITFLVLYLVLQYVNENFLIAAVEQNLFKLTFAASLPIHQIVLLLLGLLNLISYTKYAIMFKNRRE